MSQTTALLIIDMQEFFRTMTTSALPHILALADYFQQRNLPIICTQHGHSKEELTPPFSNQLVKKWGPDGSIKIDSEDWELMTEIADFVRKSRRDLGKGGS